MTTGRDFGLVTQAQLGVGLSENLCADIRSTALVPYLAPRTIVHLPGKYPPGRRSKIPILGDFNSRKPKENVQNRKFKSTMHML